MKPPEWQDTLVLRSGQRMNIQRKKQENLFKNLVEAIMKVLKAILFPLLASNTVSANHVGNFNNSTFHYLSCLSCKANVFGGQAGYFRDNMSN